MELSQIWNSTEYQKSRDLFFSIMNKCGITDPSYDCIVLSLDKKIKIQPKKRWSEDEVLLLAELELNGFIFTTYDPKMSQLKRKYKPFKTVYGLLKFIENAYK